MENTLQLILREDIQKIFDNFAATVNKKVVFFSSDGEILRNGLSRHNSEFCQIIQQRIFNPAKCRQMDLAKMKESVKAKAWCVTAVTQEFRRQ
ncbi:MAG: PocR ligand-binding domain-containing protein [Victivallaceae bacterium]